MKDGHLLLKNEEGLALALLFIVKECLGSLGHSCLPIQVHVSFVRILRVVTVRESKVRGLRAGLLRQISYQETV